jgi:uncharacterized protein YjbJ (UPF0337 family)
MQDSTKDKVQGTAHELKGAIKEKVGHATKNTQLENDGADEKLGQDPEKGRRRRKSLRKVGYQMGLESSGPILRASIFFSNMHFLPPVKQRFHPM